MSRNQDSRRGYQNNYLVANQSLDAAGLVAHSSAEQRNDGVHRIETSSNGDKTVQGNRYSPVKMKSRVAKWCPICYSLYRTVMKFFDKEKEMDYYNERMRKVMSSEQKREADWELVGVNKRFIYIIMFTMLWN